MNQMPNNEFSKVSGSLAQETIRPNKKGSGSTFFSKVFLLIFVLVLLVSIHLYRSTQGHILFDATSETDSNVGPVHIIKAGQYSRYISWEKSNQHMLDAFRHTPYNPLSVNLDASTSFEDAIKPGVSNGCIIRNYARPWIEPKVYFADNNRASPVIWDRATMDFATPTHEYYHCIYSKIEGKNIQRGNDFDNNYLRSVMETAADLGMILLYAKSTGNFDIYDDFISVVRLSDVNKDHLTHSTAWSIKTILNQLEPEGMRSKSSDQINEMVWSVMANHFQLNGFLINPATNPDRVTPAMQAIRDEILAQHCSLTSGTESTCVTPSTKKLIEHLRADLTTALENNHRAFYSKLTLSEQKIIAHNTSEYTRRLAIDYVKPGTADLLQSGSHVSAQDVPF